jgi:hypothetical protein
MYQNRFENVLCIHKSSNPAYGGMRIFTVSARKRNRKEVSANYIKTRINIGCQNDRWMKLKEALRVQTHAEVTTTCKKYLDKKNHQNHRQYPFKINYLGIN